MSQRRRETDLKTILELGRLAELAKHAAQFLINTRLLPQLATRTYTQQR